MIESIDMKCGERRRVYIAVKSICRQPFEISNATFSFTVGDELDAQGYCDVIEYDKDEVLLGALIQPMRKNSIYMLRFSYEIYPTKLYYDVKVRVS